MGVNQIWKKRPKIAQKREESCDTPCPSPPRPGSPQPRTPPVPMATARGAAAPAGHGGEGRAQAPAHAQGGTGGLRGAEGGKWRLPRRVLEAVGAACLSSLGGSCCVIGLRVVGFRR